MNKISDKYVCSGCSFKTVWGLEQYREQGMPVCSKCDIDMTLEETHNGQHEQCDRCSEFVCKEEVNESKLKVAERKIKAIKKFVTTYTEIPHFYVEEITRIINDK